MKTPDEIKKGLAEAPHVKYVVDDPSRDDVHYERYGVAIGYVLRDNIVSYIQKLESHIEELVADNNRLDEIRAKLERERDAAVVDIRNAKWCLCHVCQNYYRPDPDVRHYECKVLGKFSDLFSPSDFEEEGSNPISMCGKFKWRGVCEENTKER